MSYQTTDVSTVGQMQLLAQRIQAGLNTTIKYVSVSGNTISFYKNASGTGTPEFTIDFPQEFFLDQTKTVFVQKFTFDATTYAGATNPNLDGKPVMVLAVKGTDGSTTSTTYSFLNMAALVDTYTAKTGDSAKILNIAGYEIEFKIDPSSDIVSVTANGLKVDASGKANKVANPTAGNVAGVDANGNPMDTGIPSANVLTTANIATDAEVNEMLAEVFGD